MILFVDPSSTRTGYALMDSATHVIDAGYLDPHSSKAKATARIESMTTELLHLAGHEKPEMAVMEIPSGHVNTRRHKGRGAGLSIYGRAVGALWWAVSTIIDDVKLVNENDWTGGVPKAERRRRIAALFPQYRANFDMDSGGDASDAIGLGAWWFRIGRLMEE